jgi:NADH-quinone oxidoreductase subunit F/NADP-reducing hydrogenase subunit HndC
MSLDELNKARQKYSDMLALREHRSTSGPRMNIIICGGTGCLASDSDKVQKNLELLLKARGYTDDVKIVRTGCFGFCEQGPIVKIEPDNVFYVRVSPKDAKDIVDEHIAKGNIVERLLYEDPQKKEKVRTQEEMSFYKKQLRIALRNCGVINPEDIFESIAAG